MIKMISRMKKKPTKRGTTTFSMNLSLIMVMSTILLIQSVELKFKLLPAKSVSYCIGERRNGGREKGRGGRRGREAVKEGGREGGRN